MNKKRLRQHTIDFIFPIALFFVFAASSLVVLILSANIYRNITEHSRSIFTTRTCLSYITEKIRQNDENGTESIYIGNFDGCRALIMEHTYGDIPIYMRMTVSCVNCSCKPEPKLLLPSEPRS